MQIMRSSALYKTCILAAYIVAAFCLGAGFLDELFRLMIRADENISPLDSLVNYNVKISQ